MALDPIEWIVIGVIVLVVFMWGPAKIPELAKSLGLAKKQFDDAKKQFDNPTQTLMTVASQAPTQQTTVSGDDLLIQTARKMGIATEGKTREQITNEMVARTSASKVTQA